MYVVNALSVSIIQSLVHHLIVLNADGSFLQTVNMIYPFRNIRFDKEQSWEDNTFQQGSALLDRQIAQACQVLT
jgi:hypothetical protein